MLYISFYNPERNLRLQEKFQFLPRALQTRIFFINPFFKTILTRLIRIRNTRKTFTFQKLEIGIKIDYPQERRQQILDHPLQYTTILSVPIFLTEIEEIKALARLEK
jgi:hypothetical protein